MAKNCIFGPRFLLKQGTQQGTGKVRGPKTTTKLASLKGAPLFRNAETVIISLHETLHFEITARA